MAITREAIWNAADELDAEGMRPTLQAVRKRLGSGSFTTISDAMTEWKNRKQAQVPSQEAAPSAVMDHLAEAGAAIWAMALAQATKRLDEDRARIEAEKQTYAERAAEAADLADTLTQENERLQKQLAGYHDLERERDKLADQLSSVKKRSADELNRCMEKANRRDTEAMEARKEAKQATERAAHLEGQLAALKDQLAQLTASVKGTR